MLDYSAFFETVYNELNDFCHGFAKDLHREIRAAKHEIKPSIMFYGVYNAGKSTLLNALISENRAAVADRPMTDSIDTYQWQGYEILDTPGIDAPIEHQKTTEEQLLKTDVVLFVVSSDTFENEYIYERMALLAKQNKPLLLIVNMKQTLSKQEQIEVGSRIAVHLERVSISHEKPEVKFVNAKSALKGKLEDKNTLLKESGMLELEKQLTNFLKRCNSKTKANTYANRLKELVQNEITLLANEIAPLDIKNISTLTDLTNQTKRLIILKLKTLAISIPLDYRDELKKCLENGNNVEPIINKIFDEFKIESIESMSAEYLILKEELEVQLKNDNVSMRALNKDYAIRNDLSIETIKAENQSTNFDIQKAIAFSLAALKTAPPVIIYGIPIIKIAAVGLALFSVIKDNSPSQSELDDVNREEKENQIKKMSMISSAIKDIFSDIDTNLQIYIDEIVVQNFVPIENKLQELRHIQDEHDSKLKQTNQKIDFLNNQVGNLENFIES
jgi:GTP-binding protein EngB required for normal cell division